MVSRLRFSLIAVIVIFLCLSGCYNKKIRHLASDASLIKVGSSTRNDVLTYLGEPDGQRSLTENREEWVYLEEKPSSLQRTPVVGGYFDGRGYDKIFIILENDVVQSCQFREFEEDELDWADDFDWQEKQE
jgi:outer membrane protein assembly factor BamE (lipoprotein component of BamABCDE complex)